MIKRAIHKSLRLFGLDLIRFPPPERVMFPESTTHEPVHLFPRISKAGVIILDDYGHWLGQRKACDEYFSQNRIPILLNRIDYTGRIALKP